MNIPILMLGKNNNNQTTEEDKKKLIEQQLNGLFTNRTNDRKKKVFTFY